MKGRLLLIAILSMSACSVDPFPHELEEFAVPESGVKTLIIGDWGRNMNVNLKANAYMMNELACRIPVDAVLTTGDNFYENGVSAVNDVQWNVSFENIFTGACLLPIPWFPSLGNHDARGNTQAQIDYSLQSNRWNLPAAYHDFWMEKDSVSAHFIVVDTTPFVGSDNDDPNSSTGIQLLWLDSVLGSGNPDWTVVYGHHPVYAADGKHGETEELVEKFVPIFDAHGLDVYFCGHNHSLELIKTETKTLYVTSGGGSTPQSSIQNKPYNLFGVAEAGFVLSSFAKDSIQIDFVSKKGQRLFSYASPQTP
ncbi:MAG: metallophosphoesterase [Flavobacteriales bacterium]|nr:metallophosphoesterase [Flavobacteriales bacterium]